jgi:hypothetical protein
MRLRYLVAHREPRVAVPRGCVVRIVFFVSPHSYIVRLCLVRNSTTKLSPYTSDKRQKALKDPEASGVARGVSEPSGVPHRHGVFDVVIYVKVFSIRQFTIAARA